MDKAERTSDVGAGVDEFGIHFACLPADVVAVVVVVIVAVLAKVGHMDPNEF